jgi:large-conductance mechanosensitive channel
MSIEISEVWILAAKIIGLIIGFLLVTKIVRSLMHRTIVRILRLRDGGQGESNIDRRISQRADALTAISNSIITSFITILAFLIFLDLLKVNLAPLLAGASKRFHRGNIKPR